MSICLCVCILATIERFSLYKGHFFFKFRSLESFMSVYYFFILRLTSLVNTTNAFRLWGLLWPHLLWIPYWRWWLPAIIDTQSLLVVKSSPTFFFFHFFTSTDLSWSIMKWVITQVRCHLNLFESLMVYQIPFPLKGPEIKKKPSHAPLGAITMHSYFFHTWC